MKTIVLDLVAQNNLLILRNEHKVQRTNPFHWLELLDELNYEEFGVSATKLYWYNSIFGKATLFTSHVTYQTILVAIFGGRIVYLCWGIPRRVWWKNLLIKIVLMKAKHVLVNDKKTELEISKISGRYSEKVPYFIDVTYFQFKKLEGRKNFLFCNGSNDRDPEVLFALAKSGFKILWLVNDKNSYKFFKGRHPNLELIQNISFQVLREIYQECSINLMPLSIDRHCAGQTTGMEAISCGAPIIISEGRTSSIFYDIPSVITVSSNNVDDWIQAIEEMFQDEGLSDKVVFSRKILEKKISKVSVKNTLKPFFY